MRLRLFQVDAFASRLFSGNPAAVCPLDQWLDDALLQAIAAENNLSETAYFVAEGPGYRLRWFTPTTEVDLCGHATLASAQVLFEHLGYSGPEIVFHSRGGELRVRQEGDRLAMDLPAISSEPLPPPQALVAGLGRTPRECLAADDYLAVLGSEAEVRSLMPDLARLMRLDRRGVIVTAPGEAVDFVSRFFAPRYGIPEDPVTGSAHCALTPYWAARLGRVELRALQVSARGGELGCTLTGDRVRLTGRAVTYLAGEVLLPD